ncbi:cytochrome P450 6B2-like [Leguminivora glycinivorella]|uniref:cytochrome P450 6B2-like n=1 Tax=Leguminivora glycinivorella TaxID=1035111 RepID=UPI00200F989F|nr:cytochrome P450 6B2-like [Leguminivora glycinivorella]XP_047995698.1 cytochrome P450 6B2-like [Leguminivora glycinivorella]
MVLFTALTLAAAVVVLLYYHFTRTFSYWKDRNVPGPKPIPLFGNLYDSTVRSCTTGAVFKKIYENYPNEKVVGVFRMTSPTLLVRDLNILKHIFIKDFDNFADRGLEFSKKGLGQNLFHSDGTTWRGLRSRFSHIFTNSKLKNMMHLLNDRGDKFVDYLSESVAKSPEHNLHALVQKYTMSTITACAFGLDIDTLRGDIDSLKRIDKLIFTPNFATELDMLYPGILKELNMSAFPAAVTSFFKELVKSVTLQRNGMPTNRKDFMDLILEMKNKERVEITKKYSDEKTNTIEITDNVIAAQAFVFYAAGYETTASTMGFLLYHLALDIQIQDRLRTEIDEYLKKHNNKIELDTLNDLQYLDQVFSETLRMYPIVDTLQRKALNDYHLPGTDVKVAKGQLVLASVWGIHHDEKYYPEPEKFDPERFSPENIAARDTMAYLPFGQGPRYCIGMRFAHVQSRVCIIRLLSTFRLEVNKNTVRSLTYSGYRIFIAPKEEISVNIYPR